MSKIFKNLGCLVLITIFAFLLKNQISAYNIAGIIGIYFSVYSFIKLNAEEFENFEGEEIITILISYMLQKAQTLLYKEVYKNKIYLTVNIIMMFIFLGIFLYKYRKKKNISLENIWNSFCNFLIITIPFFLIIGSKFPILILIINIIQSVRKKECIWDKDIKKIYISILCLILFSLTSFIGNDIDSSQIKMFRRFAENLIMLMLFLQLKVSDENIKKIVSVGISSAVIPIIPVIVQFLQMKNLYYRYGEDNANIWGLEAVFWTIILLYFILFKNKKECILLYLVYILGNILSGSRGAILAMIIVNILLLVYKNINRVKILISIFIFSILVIVGLLNTNNRISYTYRLIKNEKKIDNSSAVRLVIYKESWEQFKLKPVNGFGFDGYNKTSFKRNLSEGQKYDYIKTIGYSAKHSHNNILNFLCTTGILGAISYVSVLFFMLRKIIENMLLIQNKDGFILALGIIMSYELCGLVDTSLFYGSQQRLMYFIVGLYIAYITPKISFSKKEKSE